MGQSIGTYEQTEARDDDDDEKKKSSHHRSSHNNMQDESSSNAGIETTYEEGGRVVTRPYKREVLEENATNAHMDRKSKADATLDTLTEMGVTCYIVEYGDDMLRKLRDVVREVAKRNRTTAVFNPRVHQRCLLYRDHEGRLFNVVLSQYAVGPAGQWANLLDTFSGLQAMAALVVLVRSIPCAFKSEDLGGNEPLRPAYLSLILGLVLSEEISLSWLNAAMLVRAVPSVAAYSLTSRVGSDWLRKSMVLCLALASAAKGNTQRYMTVAGVCVACLILLANMGSRAWYFLQWRPLGGIGDGPIATLLGYAAAVMAGLLVPYMGHREVQAGGKRALESILTTALLVAGAFVLSSYDNVQSFLVVGSETCSQEGVGLGVGIWWMVTLLVSIYCVIRFEPYHPFPDEEFLLVEEQASPVGYRVPNLPDHEVDPNLVKKGVLCVTLEVEVLLGTLLALLVGGFLILMAITELDENLDENLGNWTRVFSNRP